MKSSEQTNTFERVAAVDNFYQASTFIPMSFALVTTVHENGTTGIGPHALIFPFSITPPYSMMLISRNNSGTAGNIRRTGKCALNYIEYDQDKLQGISDMGVPGMSLEDKMKANPYSLVQSPNAEKATDPEAPLIVEEAFQVIECSWDDTFELHKKSDQRGQSYDGHFNLLIDHILINRTYETGIASGELFPDMPIFLGYRQNRQFWFAEAGNPTPISLPEVKGAEWQSVYYQANRIDSRVQFTEAACKKLTGIPKPFMREALAGIVEKALDKNIRLIDDAVLAELNPNRH